MDMVHGELSLADQFARLKVKFKKYVGSTIFVSLQLFFFNACYRTSVFWYHYFALLVVVHLNRKSVLFDDTPFVLVTNVNSEYYNRSTVQCILQIQNIKSTVQCICKTINNISVL